MTKGPRKLKPTGVKTLKRLKPTQTKAITPAEARRLAARYVMDRMFKDATVKDGAEVKIGPYVPRNGWADKGVWVVYKNSENIMRLQASDVLVVCKRTGRILYEGSACDEG